MLARLNGAARVMISEPSAKRLEIAKKFDFDDFVDPTKEDLAERVRSATGGLGADVVIVACSAKAAQEQSLDVAKKKGRIRFFGGLPKDDPVIAFDSNLLHYREISVFGAFASYANQYYQAMRLISSGKFKARDFITKTYKLEDIVEGIKTAKSAVGLKNVVTP